MKMDNKNFTGWQDRIKIDLNDPSEVEYFHSKHSHFSHQEIKDAIKEFGPYRQRVHDYLNEKTKFKSFPFFNGTGLAGLRNSSLFRYNQKNKTETKK